MAARRIRVHKRDIRLFAASLVQELRDATLTKIRPSIQALKKTTAKATFRTVWKNLQQRLTGRERAQLNALLHNFPRLEEILPEEEERKYRRTYQRRRRLNPEDLQQFVQELQGIWLNEEKIRKQDLLQDLENSTRIDQLQPRLQEVYRKLSPRERRDLTATLPLYPNLEDLLEEDLEPPEYEEDINEMVTRIYNALQPVERVRVRDLLNQLEADISNFTSTMQDVLAQLNPQDAQRVNDIAEDYPHLAALFPGQ